MSTNAKKTLLSDVLANQTANYHSFDLFYVIDEFDKGKIDFRRWYGTFNDPGYSDLCFQATYTWTGNTPTSITFDVYGTDGVTIVQNFPIDLGSSDLGGNRRREYKHAVPDILPIAMSELF